LIYTELDISQLGPGKYRSTVRDSATGQSQSCTWSLGLEDPLLNVGDRPVSIADFYRTPLLSQDLCRFGEALFNRMLGGQALVLLASQYNGSKASSPRQVFQLSVTIPPWEEDSLLGSLPLEFLTSDASQGFWFRGSYARLVRRYSTLPQGKLVPGRQLLFITANPNFDGNTADFDEDKAFRALSPRMEAAGFKVTALRKATRDRILDFVNDTVQQDGGGAGPAVHWLHFLGHGDVSATEGVVYLEDEDGGPDPISATQFATLVGPLGVQVAFLQACSSGAVAPGALSGVAQGLLNQTACAALATLAPVNAHESTSMATRFYRQVQRESPIGAALQIAADLTYSAESAEWGYFGVFSRTDDLKYRVQELPLDIEVDEHDDVVSLRPPPPAASVVLKVTREAFQKLVAEHQQAPSPQLAASMRDIDAGCLVGASGADLRLTGSLAKHGIPWEQMDCGNGTSLASGSLVVRELVSTGAGADLLSDSRTVVLVDFGVDAAELGLWRGLCNAEVSISELGCWTPDGCACLILSVPILEGIPRMRAEGRDPPFRAIQSADLIALRDALGPRSAKLVIVDFVGVAKLDASIQSEVLGGEEALVAAILRRKIAPAVLAPAATGPDTRGAFAKCAEAVVAELRKGSCLRTAMKMPLQPQAVALPTIGVSDSFWKVQLR
jgi:CHAT domain